MLSNFSLGPIMKVTTLQRKCVVSKKLEGKILYIDVQKIMSAPSIDCFKDCQSKLSCLGKVIFKYMVIEYSCLEKFQSSTYQNSFIKSIVSYYNILNIIWKFEQNCNNMIWIFLSFLGFLGCETCNFIFWGLATLYVELVQCFGIHYTHPEDGDCNV